MSQSKARHLNGPSIYCVVSFSLLNIRHLLNLFSIITCTFIFGFDSTTAEFVCFLCLLVEHRNCACYSKGQRVIIGILSGDKHFVDFSEKV